MELGRLIPVCSTFLSPKQSQTQSDDVSGLAAFLFFGGVLMILGAIGEWIVGNTFPTVVFGTFGKFSPPTLSSHSTLKSSISNPCPPSPN